ncbi:MAG TPA: hypothetical protein VEJ36_01370 [Nitrososphaerales archaeon]|nr:hypothetical protein [Nitrososphaerales archaeon]
MVSVPNAIKGLVYFSVILGVVFLAQAQGALPHPVFDIIALGWALFVVDALLTRVRVKASFYLAFVLAVLALVSSLPQTAHYAFIEEGELLPSATFILGSLAQITLVVLVPYYFLKSRRS